MTFSKNVEQGHAQYSFPSWW